MGQDLLDNRIILCPYRILLFTYGVSYGSININLWNYIFDYIIPYVNLLDPSWDLFLFHMGLAMGL